MKKMLAFLMTMLMLLAVMPVLAEEVPGEEVELTFFCGNGDVKFNEVVETLIAGFEKEYPMIKITNVTPTSSSFSEGLKSLDAVGEFPDLMEARDVPMWARAGKIAEVDPELIKLVNKFAKKKEEEPKPEPKPTAEEKLLTEIRDLLKNK